MTNIIDPRWVDRHRDAELDYVLQAMIETLPSRVNFRQFSETLAEAVTGLMHDREPELAELFDARDLTPVSTRIFSAKRDVDETWFFRSGLYPAGRDLAFGWLTYMHALKLGAPSPAKERRMPVDDFNPFANDGGFCNPIKLKMLDDA